MKNLVIDCLPCFRKVTRWLVLRSLSRWQKLAAIKRTTITFSRATGDDDKNSCSTSSMVEKGHFAVYSADEKRFVLPLEYLKNEIVMELFNLAEEELGLPSNGNLTLPCDAAFMEYVIRLIKRKASKELEKALLMSVLSDRCSSSLYLYQQETSQQFPVGSGLINRTVFGSVIIYSSNSHCQLVTQQQPSDSYYLKVSPPLFYNLLSVFIRNRMISAKKLIKLARKWQKLAAVKQKRITSCETTLGNAGTNRCSTSSMVVKGHFVVYSADQRRFVLPLEYLKNEIVRELFSLAEEEFGLPSNGPLMLPCDAAFMEYVISLINRHATKDIKKALLTSIASGRCSSSSYYHQQATNQQLLISNF
ncbi:LOW QUALITY PROTEIN: uncharacterized protein LOC110418096 [Herrania umbratica]|uniref:LOW QUALITY PROTEIN: uncharacterized protein LOC110418096 n=1 Tax=Herrania umbratica TaxID=108875 RepID=A0A6J1AHE1_9ROSI|nr:LOW QUALITY PROTEIN: uncharacterized protein LOC110418096 [Herrania umbratica]